MAEKFLEINDLKVIYNSGGGITYAVNGVSFDIEKKETLGLVGETGAGKTTTALSILQLLPERTARVLGGSIFFDGVDVLKQSDAEMRMIRGARVSMIFQDPMTSLNPVMTIGEQIAESIVLHNLEKLSKAQIDRHVDELLKMVGISPARKNSYPHEFSGGMKQRVVIAISLACNPELLIADEPTTALDVTIQAQILSLMEELKQKLNMSMLLITHDLGIVAKICDKVAVIYAGEIVEYGTFEDLFINKNHHPYTTGLFESIPNIKLNVARLKPIEGLMPDPTDLPKGCKFHPRCPQCMDICRASIPDDFIDNTHRIKCHAFSERV